MKTSQIISTSRHAEVMCKKRSSNIQDYPSNEFR